MRFFKDLSVRAKLFAGFGVVLAFSVVLAVVLLIQMGNVNSGGVYIATNSLPTVGVINQIRADEAKYRADQLWNITNTDVALSQAPISALNAANAQIQSGFHRRARLLGRGPTAIRDLAEKSEQIGQIVETITGIAEQTNLLALNAGTKRRTRVSRVAASRSWPRK